MPPGARWPMDADVRVPTRLTDESEPGLRRRGDFIFRAVAPEVAHALPDSRILGRDPAFRQSARSRPSRAARTAGASVSAVNGFSRKLIRAVPASRSPRRTISSSV